MYSSAWYTCQDTCSAAAKVIVLEGLVIWQVCLPFITFVCVRDRALVSAYEMRPYLAEMP